MGVPENQLDTLSSQGAVAQSKSTYATVRAALEESGAPYSGKTSVFLQGSYGNDTNIYADSDVDVVIMLNSVFYTDLDQLGDDDKELYEAARGDGDYNFSQFKADVLARLQAKFGSAVDPGNKAIFINGSGNRRDCDVVAAVELRRYVSFKSWSNQSYHSGICFWTSDGVQIINFPKQHSDNCTTKHQTTSGWFKPCVRILKNMRNCMVENGYLNEGMAPSYFLEGMLYNVPNAQFGSSYEDSISNAINWILTCDRTQLLCANELYYLCHPTSPVTWRSENLQSYLDAFVKFWNEF